VAGLPAGEPDRHHGELSGAEPPSARRGPLVYWERQGEDCLCAVHCLNSLLQGPYFTASALADIAQELDLEEKRLLGESLGESALDQSFSSNVDVQGNFSSQVLFCALQRWGGGLSALDSRSADVRDAVSKNPGRETGYICNLRRHWVALRRVPWLDGEDAWFNLNSRWTSGPMLVTDAWLSVFLASASAASDTVFVVRGAFEHPGRPAAASAALEVHQMLLNEEDLLRLQAEDRKRQAAEVAAAVGAAPEMPPPWRAVWSDEYSAYYFWNTATNVTQWQDPCELEPLDDAAAHRLLDLAVQGRWPELFRALAAAEASKSLRQARRYVDYLPHPRRYGFIHYAAEQGQADVVLRLISEFGAIPGLLSREGFTAADVAWSQGHAVALCVLMERGVTAARGAELLRSRQRRT